MRFTRRFVVVISASLALLFFAFAQACRPAARPSPDVVRVLPLGDSLTEGSRDPHGHQSYRGYLHTLLVQANLRVDFVGAERLTPHGGGDPDHEGHGGFTIGPDEAPLRLSCPASNLYDNLERYLASDPDFVLLLIGINDLLAPDRAGVDPRSAADKIERLVRRILALKPRTHVLLASLLPVEDSSRVGPEFDAVNARAAHLSAECSRVTFVDAYRETGLSAGDWHDGLHLSRSGAQKLAYVWFVHLAPRIRERLNAETR